MNIITKSFLLILLFGIVMVSSCIEKGKIEYKDVFTKKNVLNLKYQIMNDEFIFSALTGEILIVDSLLIISDSYNQNSFIHVFNKKSGEHIKSFGNNGIGPGELLHPISMGIDANNNRLMVYSHNQKKTLTYDIATILNERIEYEESKVAFNGPYVAEIRFANENVYVRGLSEDMRFGVKDGNDIKILWDQYPKILNNNKNREEDRGVLNYGLWTVSPDGKKVGHATYIGGIIEFFSIDDTNKMHLEKINYYYYPFYKLVEGASPLGVTWYQETIFGFEALFASNNAIYALVNGGKASENSFFPKDIAEFDWNGNGDIKYSLDISIHSFAVDEIEKRIYAITFPGEELDEDTKLVYFDYY